MDTKDVNTLQEFHTKVYESLWQNKDFSQAKIKYDFYNGIHTTQDKLNIAYSTSNNLLFYLIANNEVKNVKWIIKQYEFPISTIQDNNHNNILHLAAWNGNITIIKELFRKYKNSNDFVNLVNHRNDDGTNPLGMVFLNKLANENFIGTIKLFIEQKAFRINDYLNNKIGMNYSSDKFLQDIGGFNVLHMALIKNVPMVLDFLYQRNYKFG